MNMPIKKAIAGLKKNLDRIDRMSEKLEKICEKPEPEKGTRASLKEKLAQMQEKAGGQNRQPDMEKAKRKEASL